MGSVFSNKVVCFAPFLVRRRNRGFLKGLGAGDAEMPMFHQELFMVQNVGQSVVVVDKIVVLWKVVCFWFVYRADGYGSGKGKGKSNRKSLRG